jgi:hypothetical protein
LAAIADSDPQLPVGGPEVTEGGGARLSGERVTNNKTASRGTEKVQPSAQKLVEMVEQLQRDVTESSAKTDWHLGFEEALELEVRNLRAEVTRIAQRGTDEWQGEARGWFEVRGDLLANKVEELAKASEARLAARVNELAKAVDERADDVTERARAAAAELARAASEQRLAGAERELAKAVADAKRELDRGLVKALNQRLGEIEEAAQGHADAAVRELGERLGSLRQEADAQLAGETQQRLAAAEKRLREASEHAARKRERSARAAERELKAAHERLVTQLAAHGEGLARAAATWLDARAH